MLKLLRFCGGGDDKRLLLYSLLFSIFGYFTKQLSDLFRFGRDVAYTCEPYMSKHTFR